MSNTTVCNLVTSQVVEEDEFILNLFKILPIEDQEKQIGQLSALLGGISIKKLSDESDDDYRNRSFSELFVKLCPHSEYPLTFLLAFEGKLQLQIAKRWYMQLLNVQCGSALLAQAFPQKFLGWLHGGNAQTGWPQQPFVFSNPLGGPQGGNAQSIQIENAQGGNADGGNWKEGNAQGGNVWGGNAQGEIAQGCNAREGNAQGGNVQGDNAQEENAQGGNRQGGNALSSNAQGGNAQGGNTQGGNAQGGIFVTDHEPDFEGVARNY